MADAAVSDVDLNIVRAGDAPGDLHWLNDLVAGMGAIPFHNNHRTVLFSKRIHFAPDLSAPTPNNLAPLVASYKVERLYALMNDIQ
jgi:hypothetical protein